MFNWITKPNYLWTSIDSMWCTVEVLIVGILICKLIEWWVNK